MVCHKPISVTACASDNGSFRMRLTNSEMSVGLGTCLFLLAFWTFIPALNNGFINYDDPAYVTANLHVRSGVTWEGFKWSFLPNMESANWHPLTWFSHMLDCQLFDLAPAGHHLTSILLHAANTVVLFLALKLMTNAIWRSFFVAALFAVHPLHVESVVWIAERKDVLSTLFELLTLCAYIKFVKASQLKTGSPKLCYGLALFLFSMGLMSKPMVVTLPFVLLLLDYWPLARFKQKNFSGLVIEKTPFILLAAAAGAVTFFTQKNAGAIISMAPLPLTARFENTLVSYFEYLVKTFWPNRLAVFYPYPYPVFWRWTMVAPSAAVLAALTLFAYRVRTTRPYFIVGWFLFLGTLVPVIGIIQVGAQAMADRYSYLPLTGIFVSLVWLIHDLLRSDNRRKFYLPLAAFACVFLCVRATRAQVAYWENSGTLFRHAIDVTKNNYMAYSQLGSFLAAHDSPWQAVAAYRQAIAIYPNDVKANLKLGLLLADNDNLDEAVKFLNKVINLEPKNLEAQQNLGLIYLKKGSSDEAVRQFVICLKLDPSNACLHNNLAVALENEGKLSDAVDECKEAIRLKPDYPLAYFNLKKAIKALGEVSGAAKPGEIKSEYNQSKH